MKNSITFEAKYNIVAYLDGWYPGGHLRQAKVNALRELQSASGEALRPFFGPLRALMPSVLDRAFKREL
jgi:hypothetical protein